MSRLWRIILCVVVVSVAACATTRPENAKSFGEVSETRSGLATLYIYRTHHDIGRGVWPELYINEIKVVGLKNEGYTVIFIKPGKHVIRTEAGTLLSGIRNIPGTFEIPREGQYFLKFDRSYNQFTSFTGIYASPSFTTNYERWILVEKNEALPEISKCYFIPPYIEQLTL